MAEDAPVGDWYGISIFSAAWASFKRSAAWFAAGLIAGAAVMGALR